MLRLIVLLAVLLPSVAFGQTTNSRTHDGSGNKIPSTLGTPATGDRGLTTKDAILANRFPAAFASADNIAAQTATAMHGLLYAWDVGGGNWDRLTISNGELKVVANVTTWNGGPLSSAYNVNPIGSENIIGITWRRTVNGGSTEFGTATEPVRIDPTGTTIQPISGSVTANAGTNLNTSALLTTAAHDAAFGTAGAPDAQIRTIQGAASMTPVQVQSNSANLSTLAEQQTQTTALQLIDDVVHADNAAVGKSALAGCQFDDVTPGTTTENNVRPVRCSTRREVYTQIRDAAGNERGANVNASNELLVALSAVPTHTVNIGTFPDNEPINIAQMNGVAVTMGNGASGTGVQRVTIANDSTGTVIATQTTAANLNMRPDTSGATGAAPPARANYVGGLASGATGGFVSGFAVCDSFVNVTVSTATTTLLVTGVSGRHVRICSLSLVTAAANNVALISGTGATCGTGTTGMSGGTTAATGWNFAANGGITQGNGLGTINQTNATGDSVCIATSAATQLSGRIAYAIY